MTDIEMLAGLKVAARTMVEATAEDKVRQVYYLAVYNIAAEAIDAVEALLAKKHLPGEAARYFICKIHRSRGEGRCPECYPDSLRAEKPQAFVPCPDGSTITPCLRCRGRGRIMGYGGSAPCPECAHQQPASEPAYAQCPCGCRGAIGLCRAVQQPAPPKLEAVPPMPEAWDKHDRGPGSFCHAHEVRALHAAAVRLREMYGAQWEENDNLRAQLAEAQAALEAMKAQEPVATLWVSDRPGWGVDTCGIGEKCRALGEGEHMLYAAPVASIPLAQHEAALKQARAEERERCARVCERRAVRHAADAIRALPDQEVE